MRTPYRPTVTSLEGRTVLSALVAAPSQVIVERVVSLATPVKGTLTGIGSAFISSPVRLFIPGIRGKLGKVNVTGAGILSESNTDPFHNRIVIRKNARNSLELTSISTPTHSDGASGPITVRMQVTKANGLFAADLGTIVAVRIVPKPGKVIRDGISVSISPEK